MKYTPTTVAGVIIIDVELHRDHRGFESRIFCAAEFAEHGLNAAVAQTSLCFNQTRGTVRGLRRQVAPHAEAILVRCVRGAIVDVAVDVRPESPTFGKHVMVELSADNRRALFLPPYVAHGFQTLTDDTEIIYQISGPQVPGSEEHFRWNEPRFGIEWPLPVTVISEQDASWPLLEPAAIPVPKSRSEAS